MKEKRTTSLRDALLKALAVAAFTAVPATAFAPIATAQVFLDDVNDDVCDFDDIDYGSGTATDPYRISTVEDLAEIGDCDYEFDNDLDGDWNAEDVYYSLENDLDITPNGNYNNDGYDWNGLEVGWQPIGDYHGRSFEGHFLGNGHTISGLSIDNDEDNLGLFDSMYYAVVKDLNIVGEIDANDYDEVGALAGYDYSSKITNVHVDIDITEGDERIGGIVGEADSTHFSNVSSAGSIETNDGDYIGGIVGSIEWPSNIKPKIVNASSSMDINRLTGTDETMYSWRVGGIVGSAWDTDIINPVFSGTVTGDDELGGIVGFGNSVTISNATVTEDALIRVPKDDDAEDIGGIAGWLNDHASVNNSVFAGEIDAVLDWENIWNVGGLVGDVEWANIIGSTVSSTAEINVHGDYDYEGDDESYNVGGLVGEASDVHIFSSQMNANLTVNEVAHVGGLVGDLEDGIVSSSVNRGNVTAYFEDDDWDGDNVEIGGLVGNMYNSSELSNSTNKGDVVMDSDGESVYGVGGLVGALYEGKVVDNYNTGDVSGLYEVGGIIGELNETDAVVSRNYSLGKLTGWDSDPDGIATLDADFEDLTNVVLLNDNADNETNAIEMTAAELKDASELVDAGWLINVDGGDWATDLNFNKGYPYLVWEVEQTEIDEPVVLADVEFLPIQFTGPKRFRLFVDEKNYLNSVAAEINADPFSEVDIDVYYGKKVALAGKRARSVKRWLVTQEVGAPISVHILPADEDHAVGEVYITAYAD